MITAKKEVNSSRPRPVVLCVLDGWGIAAPFAGNVISNAKLPNFEKIAEQYPITALSASGEAVGLPWGEIGNSEVGHLNLGAGRVIYQELPRINKTINDNTFFKNKALVNAAEHVKKNKSSLHLMGLISNGGVHAAVEHLIALVAFASQYKFKDLYIHLFLDGRDMPFDSGQKLVTDLERTLAEYKVGKIATVSGRFYAMDRNNNWDRTAETYNVLVHGKSKNTTTSAVEAITDSYAKKVYDEEFVPTIITKNNKPITTIKDNDAIVFFNFRADRTRQLTKAFVVPSFNKFADIKAYKNLHFVTMTEYEKDLPVDVAFPPTEIKQTLGEVIAEASLKQLRIAETEKYAHVTYFFNGGDEQVMKNEERVVIPSPNVESYAKQPKMSAPEVTARLKKEIRDNTYDFILVNYANGDMVGHTGDKEAATVAVEYLDKAIGELAQIVLAQDGVMLITADHGNVEEIFNMKTGSINKEHSTNPVPLVIIGKEFEGQRLQAADIIGHDLSLLKVQGVLADVAPTILKIMQLKKPAEMTGRALI